MDISQYKTLFLQETEEHIKGINEELLKLEKEPHSSSSIDNLFRHFHSIKGMAASMGYEIMSSASHELEDLLDAVRKKKINLEQEIIDVILSGADVLKTFTKLIAEDKSLEADSSLLSKIKDILTRKEKSASEIMPQAEEKQANEKYKNLQPDKEVLQPAISPQPIGLPTTMKIDSSIFDDFMKSIGELFTVRSQLREIVTNTFPVEFQETIHRLGRIIEDLYYAMVTARMIQFEYLTQNLPRIVRDMCKKKGKDIELVIHGSEVKLDRAVLEHMIDPLVHIVRNAVDHGIETPKERAAAGKPAKGRITITASRQRDNIIIDITDDGKGIDINKVKEKALSAGVAEEKIKGMPDEEALLLVCMPGLSLATEITETSGRGVGMDVVKGNVESIGGKLEISSEVSRGTKITLELPVTITILKVLLIRLGDELFALPISKTLKVMDIKKKDIKYDKYPPYFVYDNTDVHVVDLRSILAMPPLFDKDTVSVAMIAAKEKPLGIIVDDFEGEIDAYIKPLPQPMVRMRGVTGITVLGDGRPVFLLDPTMLFS